MPPRSPRYAVTIHRGLAGLAALREAWTRLVTDRPGRFFADWRWQDASLRSLDPDPESVIFVRLDEGGRPVAIVPLKADTIRRRGMTARRLRLPHYDHPPLADLVRGAGDLTIDEILDALAAGLREAKIAWDVLELGPVLSESPLAQPPRQWGWRSVRHRVKTCDQVRGDEPWDDFAARLSTNFRANLKNARNRIAKQREPVYSIAKDVEAMRALLPAFMELEASGWKGQAGTSMGQDPRTNAFYTQVLEVLGAAGRVRINSLSIGGRPIAMQYCLVDGDTIYIHKLAYDESQAKLSPGNALLLHVINSGEFRWVNVEGSPPWFQPWKPEHDDVISLSAFNTTPIGALLLALTRGEAMVRPWIQRIREARAAKGASAAS